MIRADDESREAAPLTPVRTFPALSEDRMNHARLTFRALCIHVFAICAIAGCGSRDISIGENADGGLAEGASTQDAGHATVTCGLAGMSATCDVTAGETCCIFQKAGSATCKNACTTEEIAVAC